MIAPVYEQLASQLSTDKQMTFSKVNTDEQQQIAQANNVTAMPTFVVFKAGKEVHRIRGADTKALSDAVKKLAAEASGSGEGFAESSGSSNWLGASLPRGYTDVTEEVDVKGLDLLNADSEFGSVRTLFDSKQPSAAASSTGKSKASGSDSRKDWVESDTDEQLMLFVPFQATLKVHTIQITSIPSNTSDDDDEVPMRPKTIKLYANRAHNLGFEEADDMPATQELELKSGDWDAKTGTARLELRFVKFQNVTSLVLFVVDGDGDGEKVRVDRIRFIGESGSKREMGKLEKIGDEQGE